MNEADVYAALTDIFRDLFDDDGLELSPATSAADVAGWDSMKMIEIIVAVEMRYSIKINTREADRLTCIGDFVALIIRKKGT